MLRTVVERAVEHGRRALQLAQVGPRRPPPSIHHRHQIHPPPRHKLSKWQSEGGVGGAPGGRQTPAECGGGQSSGSTTVVAGAGLVSRLRPVTTRLVQSFIRKVSAPLWAEAKRCTTKRLVFGESAPYFALVGVTLVSGSQQCLLTKEDELEAVCCNIREAISRAGWLHNPEYWQQHNKLARHEDEVEESFVDLGEEHVFALSDFQLSSVIDKGSSAVVYAARWNKDETKDISSHSPPQKRQRSESPLTVEDNLDDIMGENWGQLSFMPLTEQVQPQSSFTQTNDQMTVGRQHTPESNTHEEVATYRGSSVDIAPKNNLSTGASLLGAHGGSTKKVKFLLDDEQPQSDNLKEFSGGGVVEALQGAIARTPAIPDESAETDTTNETSNDMKQFPLAMKMMFNYEAESNAPAILRAMYKEMMPARNLQLDGAHLELQEMFCSKHMRLPPHPNIVEMPCVFVDRVPFLEDSMQLYPDALPSRLNPRGYGRNMSLFCVMKRYDASLRDYLAQHKPPAHTSLLLLTQLLEALLHINNHNVAHRDLKSDNILLCLDEGWQYPLLVISDFGCSVSGDSGSITVPFPSREADPRQGNAALMAPEVKTAVPGLLRHVNFTHSDLWAVGTLAYEIYGVENPFCLADRGSAGGKVKFLDSVTYKESQLPRLPKSVPAPVKHLIHDILRRNPRNRPSVNVAATLCQLMLWAPSKWLCRRALTLPTQSEIMQWLLCLATKVLCEAGMSRTQNEDRKRQKDQLKGQRCERQGGQLEYELVSTFLARVHYMDIIQAIKWNRAF